MGRQDAPYGYTVDPDQFESDRTLGRTPIYQEEAGFRDGKRSAVTLQPCQHCGVPVICGVTDRGALVPVEPQTDTYALVWMGGEPRPRLTLGRGYPAHRCRAPRGHASKERV